MTQNNNTTNAQLTRVTRSLVAFAAVFFALWANGAAAQVELVNTIKKVDTFVDESGAVQRRLVEAASVVPGDELQYTVRFANRGDVAVDPGTIVITDVIPVHTEYLDGTAFGSGTEVSFSVDGEAFAAPADLNVLRDGVETPAAAKDYRSIRWHFAPELAPGSESYVTFNVRLK